MKEDRRAKLLTDLGDIVAELGWSIIIPVAPKDNTVDGVIVGTTEFLEQMLYRFQDHNDELVFLDKDGENKILSKIEKTDKKDDDPVGGSSNGTPTFH